MKAPSNGVATSNAAAVSIQSSAGDLCAKVLGAIRIMGGLTCDEVENITNLKHQTASARVHELMKQEAIVDSGNRRLTRSGRKAIVWVVAKVEASAPRCVGLGSVDECAACNTESPRIEYVVEVAL